MKGISYTYFTTDNAKSARELVTILKEAKAVVPPQLEEMAMYGGGGGGGRGKLVSKTVYNVKASELHTANRSLRWWSWSWRWRWWLPWWWWLWRWGVRRWRWWSLVSPIAHIRFDSCAILALENSLFLWGIFL